MRSNSHDYAMAESFMKTLEVAASWPDARDLASQLSKSPDAGELHHGRKALIDDRNPLPFRVWRL
jgi:hypothetical protein